MDKVFISKVIFFKYDHVHVYMYVLWPVVNLVCVCKITVKERVRFWREIEDRVALGCDDRLCTQKVIAREKKVDRVVKGSWNRISLIRARGCQKT